MGNENCEMIKDLLPLYVDDICSEESKNYLEKHLKECENCKKFYQNIKQEIAIPENREDTIIKQVKKRIFIEKVVTTIIVVFVVVALLFFGTLNLLATYTPMTEASLADTLAVYEDADGNVWVKRSGMAVDAKMLMKELKNTDGELIVGFRQAGASDVDTSHVVVRLEVYETKLTKLSHKLLGNNAVIEEEQSILFNAKEKDNWEKIIIEENGKELVLWKK